MPDRRDEQPDKAASHMEGYLALLGVCPQGLQAIFDRVTAHISHGQNLQFNLLQENHRLQGQKTFSTPTLALCIIQPWANKISAHIPG